MNSDIRFAFSHLPNTRINYLDKKETKEWLSKWSMQDGIRVQAFYFDRKFKIYLLDDFVRDFFGSMHVMQSLLRAAENHQFVPINVQAESVTFHKIRSTLTTTEIFDRLVAEGSKVARPTGSIIKCLPDYFQPDNDVHDHGCPIEIGDQIRKMILLGYCKSDSEPDDWWELKDLYTTEEKDEFLFRLFGHFVIGGSLCQYEDTLGPYVDTAKLIYKGLMSISKSKVDVVNCDMAKNEGSDGDGDAKKSTKLVVNSVVVKVTSVKNEHYTLNDLLFTHRHINNFFYIIIQPEEQTVFTLYHNVV